MSPDIIILLLVVAACYAYSKGRARGQSENIAKAVARFFESK